MKLTLEGIKETRFWEEAEIELPKYDVEQMMKRTKESPLWVHFGAGNIFRIFIGGVAESLLEQGEMDRGITCVEAFDLDIIDQIYKPHDNLVLSVTLREDGSIDKQVTASLAEAMKAEAGRLTEVFTNPELQMVSFTITEKGYAFKGTDDAYFPWIREEIEKGPAAVSSAMGMVCAQMYNRYKAGALPIALVSMDNCSHNGEKLQNAIITMAREWMERGYVEPEFIAYLRDDEKVGFPWTMIDKITPRPAESVYDALSKIGIEDIKPIITSKNTYIAPFVNAEGPQYLVIEDGFPNGRPALEKAGVYLTDRDTVNKVERMKVTTCLNPLHTALAVYGCVLGYTLIADEMKDEELRKLIMLIGPEEGMKVVTDPGIISPKEFVKEVIEVRFPNPFMPDAPQRIATDTSQKVGVRFGETIKAYVNKYGDARKLKAIPLAIAGWCRYLLGVDDKGQRFELSTDPMLEELQAALAGVEFGKQETYCGQLKKILANDYIFGIDLYQAAIGELIEDLFVEEIEGPGAVRRTLKKYL
ncbi:MAG: mannitol dehydrogenase family protein [Lachnospiraceae bacterium]